MHNLTKVASWKRMLVSNRSCPPSQTLHLQLLFMMSGHQLSIGNLRLLTFAWKIANIYLWLCSESGEFIIGSPFFGEGGRGGVGYMYACPLPELPNVFFHISRGKPVVSILVSYLHIMAVTIILKPIDMASLFGLEKKIMLLVHMKLLMFFRWSKQWWITSSSGSQLILGDHCCQK